MEAEYEEVLTWVDPGPGEAASSGTETPGPWGEGIHLYGVLQPLKGHHTASLMADSYGFASTEELSRVQKYLHEHGRWQLEQVSYQSKRSWSLVIDSHVMHWSLEWSLVFTLALSHLFVFQVSGMGNCLYASIKKGLGVHLTNDKKFPYYPNCYFC